MDNTRLFIKLHVLMKIHTLDEVRGKHIRYLIITYINVQCRSVEMRPHISPLHDPSILKK